MATLPAPTGEEATGAAKAAGGKVAAGKAAGKGKGGAPSKKSDPSNRPGPAPKIGTARPGGGTHGDGEATRKKRIAHFERAAREEKRLQRKGPNKKRKIIT